MEPSFDFAISYAGPDRSIAKALANNLSGRGAAVFLDTLYRAELVGKRLDHSSGYSAPVPSTSFLLCLDRT